MKKTILFTILFSLSIIRTTSAQTVTPTINGTPPPFTFTGAVTQTGQNFNFTGGGGGSFSTITSGTNTSTLVIGSGGSLSTTGTGTISATTAITTPNPSDSSTAASTNQFVQNAIQLSMATVPLSITGGIYSFDSQGSGAAVVVGVSGGAVSSIITWVGGTGYAVGDLVTVNETGSNFDAYICINAVTSGAPTSGTIVYGGTGYSSFGGYSATPALSSIPFTFLLSGTLTSNAQFIMTHGTYLTQSNQWIFANNTTGAFTTNICVAGATDACSGGRTVTIAQGTNNSTSRLLQTDGELNVDSSEAGLLLAGLPASFSSLNGTTLSTFAAHTFYGNNTGATAAPAASLIAASDLGGISCGTATGLVNVMAITCSPAPSSLAALVGIPITFLTNLSNTGSATLNVNGLGAKTILNRGITALNGADVSITQIAVVIYDGTNWELQSAHGASGTGVIVLTGSPSFTGTPTAPTAAVGTNTTQLADTAFVLANSSALIVNNAITSATGGTNTGTVTCLTATCTNVSGTYSVAGGTFTTGNLLVLVWPTTTAAYKCWTSQNDGVAVYAIGHSVATATGMTITAGISVAAITVIVDYGCSQY